MKIFTTVFEINKYLSELPSNQSIGFVPTMGALHQGHIELVKHSLSENNITVCSIFVNPIQFNNQEDLLKYPRTFDTDVRMLEETKCDVLFYPTVQEMYPTKDETEYDFGHIETVMEGKFRPGHFRGVAIVVRRLFEIVRPNRSYFGKKDYQQLKIIEKLVEQFDLNVDIIPCEIVREMDGLAMSSRNRRLNPQQREMAPKIYQTLQQSTLVAKSSSVEETIQFVIETLNALKGFEVEYFTIANQDNLKPIDNWNECKHAMGFLVVHVGEIRLIDNINFIL